MNIETLVNLFIKFQYITKTNVSTVRHVQYTYNNRHVGIIIWFKNRFGMKDSTTKSNGRL